MKRLIIVLLAVIGILAISEPATAETGDPGRGAGLFRACGACHALQPNKNMTGPSLADLWNRKAGGLSSFQRYSPALKSSGVVWDDQTLDAWLNDPAHFIPGNTMTFPGIRDTQQRADMLAFLKEATQPGRAPPPQASQPGGPMGGMAGMMGGGQVPNLKTLDPEDQVQAITYCADTYRVSTADGKTHVYWERNLRFKTDSGEDGPQKKAPALVAAGMMGDRADVIFAEPQEMSGFIAPKC
jgi:cytochrome c